MVTPGIFNLLPLLRIEGAVALLGGAPQPIPLPLDQLPAGVRPGESVEAFIHHDAGDRLVATTRRPKAQVGEVACLKIVGVKDAGAFLDWGLPKDLLLPWREVPRGQKHLVAEGKKLLVMVIHDEEGREAASARLSEFLSDTAEGFTPGQAVDLVVADPTELGVRVVVNHAHWGLVHRNEIFGTLRRGERRTGYIKALRPDGRLNIALAAPGYAKADPLGQAILALLERRGGFLPVTDKSAPEAIHDLFGASKKAFKLALGVIYKKQLVTIEDDGIRLVRKS